jgi:hypothetical protein
MLLASFDLPPFVFQIDIRLIPAKYKLHRQEIWNLNILCSKASLLTELSRSVIQSDVF